MKPAALLSSLFLALIALAHLLRLALATPVTVGGAAIPLWLSVPAVLGPGALAIWLWKEQQRVGTGGRAVRR
jgi:hypothetical protein